MNMEAHIAADPAGQIEAADMRRRRVALIALAIVLVLVAGIGFAMVRRHFAAKPATASAAPQVTVIRAGRQAITAQIAAVGTIGARRDMQVGVAGEGGVVRAVLVEPGDWVKAGQVLATIDRSVQTQQAAALSAGIEQARADARLAKSNLDRARALVKNGFISKADLETKASTLDAANARVAVAQAQLGQQRALIGRLDIRAPADGLVLTRAVEAGQVVGAGTGALFRVAAEGAMELQARLSETDLARLHVGSPATVTPVGTTLKVAGRIWQIAPVIDPATRQGTVRIALPYEQALRPGGFAAAQIGGGQGDVPLLPESAVLSDAAGNYVYIVGPDDQVARRAVTVGDVDDRGVSITGGLTGGEHVIASAGAFLNPGDKVQPHLQPMAK